MQYYKELLKLLEEYKKTKIWEQVSGDDIFKIKGYKKPIYVAILGQEKKVYEINLYFGKEDLYSQYDIVYGEYQTYPDYFFRLSCYKFVLDDPKNLLSKEDAAQLKKYRIKSKLTIFRLSSGKKIRLINEEEAKFLIPVLQDIIQISRYIKEQELKFSRPLRIDQHYAFSIKDQQVSVKKEKFPLEYEIREKVAPINQELVNKILIFSQGGTFGMNLFYGPNYNIENKSFDRLLILSDLETDKILDIQIIPSGKEEELINYVLSSFYKIKKYPKNLAFGSTKDFLRCKQLIPELQINYRVDTGMLSQFKIWQEFAKYLADKKI